VTPGDLLWAIRPIVERTYVIGMDVVEVCPPYDPSELAAQNANRAVMQAISVLAVKRRLPAGAAELVS
jgi:agmatinase